MSDSLQSMLGAVGETVALDTYWFSGDRYGWGCFQQQKPHIWSFLSPGERERQCPDMRNNSYSGRRKKKDKKEKKKNKKAARPITASGPIWSVVTCCARLQWRQLKTLMFPWNTTLLDLSLPEPPCCAPSSPSREVSCLWPIKINKHWFFFTMKHIWGSIVKFTINRGLGMQACKTS